MNADQLKLFISEVITFLQALDRVLPNKLDHDLVEWLQSVEQQPWTCELLVKSLKK